jgi:hypothetical protein
MHRTVVLTLDGTTDAPIVHRVWPLARLASRCRKAKLDHALAGGAPPESSLALELRATALVSPKMRLDLRSDIETLVAVARRSAPQGSRWTILSPRRLRRVVDELERLAEALSAPGPVEVRGLAQTRVLLTDGCSPLYRGGSEPVDDLREAIALAVDALSVGATGRRSHRAEG